MYLYFFSSKKISFEIWKGNTQEITFRNIPFLRKKYTLHFAIIFRASLSRNIYTNDDGIYVARTYAHTDTNIILLRKKEKEGGRKRERKAYDTMHNARDANIGDVSSLASETMTRFVKQRTLFRLHSFRFIIFDVASSTSNEKARTC